MASVTAFIRVSRKRIDRANVRFRLRDGRNIQLFHASKLEINPSDWDATRQEIKAKVLYDAEKRALFNKAVADRKNMMLEIYNAAPSTETLTSDCWIRRLTNACILRSISSRNIGKPFSRLTKSLSRSASCPIGGAGYSGRNQSVEAV